MGRRCLQLASLYRGAGWTAARNAPGSFALFGANSWAKEALFDGNTDQYWKTLVTSTVGALCCLTTLITTLVSQRLSCCCHKWAQVLARKN